MHFLDATQANVVLTIGADKVSVPRFELRDFVAWAAELDAQRAAAVRESVSALDPEKRFHLLNAYTVMPASLNEVAGMIATPAGIDRVLSTCLGRAALIERQGVSVDPPEPVSKEYAAGVVRANLRTAVSLARILASMDDPSSRPPTGEKKEEDLPDEAEGSGDPLASTATPASAPSPATGSENLPSSTPSTRG